MTAVTCWLSALARTVVQPAQLHEFHPEHQDAAERAVQGRLVQSAGEHGISAVRFDSEIREGLAPDIAQDTSNGDPVAVRTHVPSTDISGRVCAMRSDPCTGTIYVRDHAIAR